MSPADIAAPDLRAGLSRRLVELGLVPPDPEVRRVSMLPQATPEEARQAA